MSLKAVEIDQFRAMGHCEAYGFIFHLRIETTGFEPVRFSCARATSPQISRRVGHKISREGFAGSDA